MTDLSRHAVFGLLDEATTHCLRSLQLRLAEKTGNRTALFFPVHVTLRGRFRTRPCLAEEAFRRFCRGDAYSPGPIELVGPVFRAPELVWLEVAAGTHAFHELARMHRDASEAFQTVLEEDEVPPEFAGAGYRPHVTLGWGGTAADAEQLAPASPTVIAARMTALALVRYPPEWPVREELTIVASEDL